MKHIKDKTSYGVVLIPHYSLALLYPFEFLIIDVRGKEMISKAKHLLKKYADKQMVRFQHHNMLKLYNHYHFVVFKDVSYRKNIRHYKDILNENNILWYV